MSTTSYRSHWEYRPEWLEWALSVWVPGGRVQLQSADDPCRLAFLAQAARAFRSRGAPFHYVKTWVSVQLPEVGSGYADGYPHTHEPPHAMTLVHYLQPSNVPVPLDIFDGDEVVESHIPEPGLTIMFRNDVKHGARKNNGTIPRVQLIATAIP